MAKKQTEGNEAQDNTFVPETETPAGSSGEFTPEGENALGIQADFDVETEYKPFPLVPNGTFHGAVTDVQFNAENQSVDWKVTLNENGGFCSDQETPIDGVVLTYSNWLPKPEDKTTPDRSGKGTKHQAKINMLKQFADNMKINMNSPVIIASAIVNKEWIGLAVDVKVKVSEFQDAVTKVGTGRFRNDIERMVQRS